MVNKERKKNKKRKTQANFRLISGIERSIILMRASPSATECVMEFVISSWFL